MSDAKLSQQDLHLSYVDVSSAFNTIDHDKALCIMHNQGFPDYAIEVIAALYTDAITRSSSTLQIQDQSSEETHNAGRYLIAAPLLDFH